MTPTSDMTAVLYTSNRINPTFAKNTQTELLRSIGDLPLVIVSQKKMNLGYNCTNVVVGKYSSHVNIYRQALLGALTADTKWIALCEDDVLYVPEHFKYRPKNKPFAYNLGYWGVYTFQKEPVFNYKGRKNLNFLICDRIAFIEAMEERFRKYPDESMVNKDIWAEPGKYERQLGVAVCETEDFWTNPACIKFSHENELSFAELGVKKRAGELRALEIPYWGHIQDVLKLSKEVV